MKDKGKDEWRNKDEKEERMRWTKAKMNGETKTTKRRE
jgi:hypothetical protein